MIDLKSKFLTMKKVSLEKVSNMKPMLYMCVNLFIDCTMLTVLHLCFNHLDITMGQCLFHLTVVLWCSYNILSAGE